MIINRILVAAGSLLASGAAFAGIAVGTPVGTAVGAVVGNRVGTFLDAGLPAMLLVAGAGLAIGVAIVRRKQKR